MRREAEAHAEEDRRKLEVINARNEADQVIFVIEKQLKEHADKVGGNDKAAIESAVQRTRDAMGRDDAQAIKQATSDLKAAASALMQHLHGQAGGPHTTPGTDGGPGGGGKGGPDDVIDAEFEVKK